MGRGHVRFAASQGGPGHHALGGTCFTMPAPWRLKVADWRNFTSYDTLGGWSHPTVAAARRKYLLCCAHRLTAHPVGVNTPSITGLGKCSMTECFRIRGARRGSACPFNKPSRAVAGPAGDDSCMCSAECVRWVAGRAAYFLCTYECTVPLGTRGSLVHRPAAWD